MDFGEGLCSWSTTDDLPMTSETASRLTKMTGKGTAQGTDLDGRGKVWAEGANVRFCARSLAVYRDYSHWP